MNAEALERTRATGELHLWSRSRGELWHKGATSGNTQAVRAIRSTATATRCSRSSSRPARPATRASAPASTAASSSPPRRTRCCPALERTIAARAAERARRAPTPRSCSPTRALRGAKVQEEAEEVARAVREESDERVAEEAADVLYHLAVLLASRGLALADAVRGAAWPSPLSPSSGSASRPALEEVRALAARAQPRPGPPDVRRGLRDARLRVPQAARRRPRVPARVGRAGPARRPLVVHRLQAAQRAALERSPTAATRTRSPPPRSSATARRRCPDLPPFAGGAVGFFGYDCVRTVEPLGRAQPRRARAARPARSCSPTCSSPSTTSSTRSRSSPTPTSRRTGVEAGYARAAR